ncbi:MAG: SDR family NAD(P)-dependent oxidoreductase [Pseudomonadota bacterium]
MSSLQPACIVTGASRGIGRAVARKFASADRAVVLIARDRDALLAAASDIEHAGFRAHALPIDITCPTAPDQLLARLGALNLTPDILINNAAAMATGELDQSEPAEIERIIDVNIRALTLLTAKVVPVMQSRCKGHVVFIASIAALSSTPGLAVYGASKAYVLAFAKSMRRELRASGVRVSTALPGPVATRMLDDLPFHARGLAALIPPASPDAVAEAIFDGVLANRATITPGLINTLGITALSAIRRLGR